MTLSLERKRRRPDPLTLNQGKLIAQLEKGATLWQEFASFASFRQSTAPDVQEESHA